MMEGRVCGVASATAATAVEVVVDDGGRANACPVAPPPLPLPPLVRPPAAAGAVPERADTGVPAEADDTTEPLGDCSAAAMTLSDEPLKEEPRAKGLTRDLDDEGAGRGVVSGAAEGSPGEPLPVGPGGELVEAVAMERLGATRTGSGAAAGGGVSAATAAAGAATAAAGACGGSGSVAAGTDAGAAAVGAAGRRAERVDAGEGPRGSPEEAPCNGCCWGCGDGVGAGAGTAAAATELRLATGTTMLAGPLPELNAAAIIAAARGEARKAERGVRIIACAEAGATIADAGGAAVARIDSSRLGSTRLWGRERDAPPAADEEEEVPSRSARSASTDACMRAWRSDVARCTACTALCSAAASASASARATSGARLPMEVCAAATSCRRLP